MVKKRLIFTLLYADGQFMLSRNFRLQKVGNLRWIENNYNLPKVARHIDELVVLDVSRGDRDIDAFCDTVSQLVARCFIPVSVGGGITNIEHARRLFHAGADKLVMNSALINDPELVRSLAEHYGSQSIVASLDCKKAGASYERFINNGGSRVDAAFETQLGDALALGIGEIYLNSMDKDGTGQGYDTELLSAVSQLLGKHRLPITMAGGAGNASHFIDLIASPDVDAVATANLFNFIGNALPRAREAVIAADMPLASWTATPLSQTLEGA